MALVNVVDEPKDKNQAKQDGKQTSHVCSLPAIPTHKVSLNRRAGYKFYGESPDELKARITTKTKSLSAVEPYLSLPPPINHPVSPEASTTPPESPSEKDGAPEAITWSCYRVGDWVRGIGYPQYEDLFKYNFINGRKLIYFRETNQLVKLGITDFEHLKDISSKIRNLLNVSKPLLYPYLNYVGQRSISLPLEEPYIMYLQERARTKTSKQVQTLSQYETLCKQTYDRAWNLPNNERKWRKHLTL